MTVVQSTTGATTIKLNLAQPNTEAEGTPYICNICPYINDTIF